MSKKAIYYDEAQRLYVKQGFALETISGMMEGQVTRRTLQNWKTDGRWDDKRKRYLDQHESLHDMVMEIAKTTARKAREKPTPKNLLALMRAISALKEKEALEMLSRPGQDVQEQEKPSDKLNDIAKQVADILGA